VAGKASVAMGADDSRAKARVPLSESPARSKQGWEAPGVPRRNAPLPTPPREGLTQTTTRAG